MKAKEMKSTSKNDCCQKQSILCGIASNRFLFRIQALKASAVFLFHRCQEIDAQACVICYEPFTDTGRHARQRLLCRHHVCFSCTHRMVQDGVMTCPVCRLRHKVVSYQFEIDDGPSKTRKLSFVVARLLQR